ncbi:ClbS/DfsB family four-helix bundle protein [Populibacterium corticicola]|uniref:ClbS/DfsB family four-helix bundle protein n=1 Tax=Populibacterium corticicola TaxID=1812826 RepID=A0ABW5XAF5_9MICO
MGRPTTKAELLEVSDTRYRTLQDLIDSMSLEERSVEFDFGPDLAGREAHWTRDQNLRDVLIHLHEWHQLLLTWVVAHQDGKQQPFLPAPYNWRTYGAMNQDFLRRHQGTSLEDALNMLERSHRRLMNMIDSFTDQELFEKQYFPWTGTTSLGSYCVSATSSHYEWATKKIRVHIKALRSST